MTIGAVLDKPSESGRLSLVSKRPMITATQPTTATTVQQTPKLEFMCTALSGDEGALVRQYYTEHYEQVTLKPGKRYDCSGNKQYDFDIVRIFAAGLKSGAPEYDTWVSQEIARQRREAYSRR